MESKMSRKELVNLYAEIRTSNWICAGDRTESQREETKRFHKDNVKAFSKEQILEFIKNNKIYDKKLESAIAKMGLR